MKRHALVISALALFACRAPDASVERASASAAPPAHASVLGEPSARPDATSDAPSAAPPPSAAAPALPLPPRDPSGLPGHTIDFPYDGGDVKARAWTGRAFVHDRAVRSTEPLPLLVFLHGLNKDLIPHRWMGGGNEGDVRRIVADLIDGAAVSPLIVAGPGSIVPSAVSSGASFVAFDLEVFLDRAEAALGGVATFDRSRVIVAGHSGAGCSAQGGLAALPTTRTRPLAIFSIDTCMPGALAQALGAAAPETHVVVTWQTASWSRSFDHFRDVFDTTRAAHPPLPGTLRELDHLPARPRAHDATVMQTFEKWLPRLVPPG